MRQEPVDALSEQDKYNIRKYFKLYGNTECGPIDIVLKEWNKNKRTLFHALGNKLKVEKTITFEENVLIKERELKSIFYQQTLDNQYSINYTKKMFNENISIFHNQFLDDFFKYVLTKCDCSPTEISVISRLFTFKTIMSKKIVPYDVFCDANIKAIKFLNYNFTVRANAKLMKTIQNCIKALGYTNIKLFKKWQEKINLFYSNEFNSATMVISINPIDFLTMSDNDCNWSSCMSWINNGSYNAGTIEMMNSNVAAVVYLKNNKDFIINIDKEHDIKVDNKTWRSLIFIHKDILLSGKQYPYYKREYAVEALQFAMDLMKKNLHKTYQYKIQKYTDIINYCGYHNRFLKWDCSPNFKGKRKIIIYMNGMYNDFIEDTESQYLCCRNPVKGLRLNLSGPQTCICCGEKIMNIQDVNDYDDLEPLKVCFDCEKNKCQICGEYHYHKKYKISDKAGFVCSDYCLSDAMYFPGQNFIISKEEFIRNKEENKRKLFIVDTKEDFNKTLRMFRDSPFSVTLEEILLKNNIIYKLEDIVFYDPMKCPSFFIPANSYSSVRCYNDYLVLSSNKKVINIVKSLKDYIPLKEYLEKLETYTTKT